MAFLAAAAPYLMAGMAAVSAGGSIMNANSAKASADFQARQLRQKANESRATAQYQAEQDRREAQITISRARAVAAASGAGADDKTVLDIMDRIGAEGEYRALANLWAGNTQGDYYDSTAANVRDEGRAAQKQGYLSAFGSALKGAGAVAGTQQPNIMSEAPPPTLHSKYALPFEQYQQEDDSALITLLRGR